MLAVLGWFSLGSLARAADSQDYEPSPSSEFSMIKGPKCLAMQDGGVQVGHVGCDSGVHEAFLTAIRHWRMQQKIEVGYDGSRYDTPALQ